MVLERIERPIKVGDQFECWPDKEGTFTSICTIERFYLVHHEHASLFMINTLIATNASFAEGDVSSDRTFEADEFAGLFGRKMMVPYEK